MKIVFFGGSGFLGSHVCDKLSEAGHDVTIVDLRPSPYLRPDQKMVTGSLLDEDLVKVHYAHLADKPFFGDIVDFMTSGPVVKMVVSGLSAVSKMRTLMGATNPLDAAPGTIRGDFANDVNANIIHGSDSLENAAIEIERFFG